MHALSFDPYRAQRLLHWHNRFARWRARPTQTLFHAGALLLLGVLLILPLLRAPAWVALLARETLWRWPLPLAAGVWLLMVLQHLRQLAALRRRQANEWLVSQPIAAQLQSRRQHDSVRLGLLLHLIAGGTLLLLIGASRNTLFAFAALAGVAAIFALPLSRRHVRRARVREALGSRIRDRGIGRLWRWQRIECGIALRGPSLAVGAWALLLVPMGSGPLSVLAVGAGGLILAALGTAWRRSLDVLPQAQAWLGAQPQSGAALLRRSFALPLALATLASLLAGSVLLALGTPSLAAASAIGIVVVAALHYASVAAERGRPQRIGPGFALQLALLLAMVQALAVLGLLCWVVQMTILLRRASRV